MGRLHRIRVFAVQAAGWRLSEALAVSRWVCYFPKNSLIDARRDNPASSGMITSTKTELQIPQ